MPEISKEPAVFKDITPAWNNINLLNLARVTRSSCILAHVRAATLGLPVIQLNCHPFVCGPFAFMHNGKIGGFQKIRRKLMNRLSDDAFYTISGSTDSEYIFALFLDHHRRISEGLGRSEALAQALAAAVSEVEVMREGAGIEEPSLLNIAITDGANAAVSRYISRDPEKANSLYVHTGGSCACSEGHFHLLEPCEGRKAVIVASEPLTEEDEWMMVAPNNMLVVNEGLHMEIRPIS